MTLCKDIEMTSALSYLLEGEKDQIEKRYREIVHLYNAQIGSYHPMTMDQVVQSVHKNEIELKHARHKAREVENVKAKIISGQSTHSVDEQFRQLVQRARLNKKRVSTESQATPATNVSPVSLQSSDLAQAPDPVVAPESNPGPVVGPASEEVWRVVYSEELQRLFFFNTETNTGQFAVPDELRDSPMIKAFHESVVSPVSSTPAGEASISRDCATNTTHSHPSVDYSMSTNLEDDLFPGTIYASTPDQSSWHASHALKRQRLEDPSPSSASGAGEDEVEFIEVTQGSLVGRRAWACDACTFLNEDASATNCAVCGTRKRMVRACR